MILFALGAVLGVVLVTVADRAYGFARARRRRTVRPWPTSSAPLSHVRVTRREGRP